MNRSNACRSWLTTVLAIGLIVTGCGYGIVSPKAYEHAKAIYTLANMKAATVLDETERAIALDAEAGNLTPQETSWLNDLCADCREGNWKEAQSAARQMMEEQTPR